MILSIIVDIAVIILIIAITANYYKFWHRCLQMYEPFTRWFSRIAAAWPWFWWPLNVLLLAGAIWTIFYSAYLYPVLGVVGVGFMGWFVPHIWSYVIEHAEDNPPHKLYKIFLRQGY
jgi:hypothetical protein